MNNSCLWWVLLYIAVLAKYGGKKKEKLVSRFTRKKRFPLPVYILQQTLKASKAWGFPNCNSTFFPFLWFASPAGQRWTTIFFPQKNTQLFLPPPLFPKLINYPLPLEKIPVITGRLWKSDCWQRSFFLLLLLLLFPRQRCLRLDGLVQVWTDAGKQREGFLVRWERGGGGGGGLLADSGFSLAQLPVSLLQQPVLPDFYMVGFCRPTTERWQNKITLCCIFIGKCLVRVSTGLAASNAIWQHWQQPNNELCSSLSSPCFPSSPPRCKLRRKTRMHNGN